MDLGTQPTVAVDTHAFWVTMKMSSSLWLGLFFMPYGNRKAVKKTCRWHVFRPWEIPLVQASA